MVFRNPYTVFELLVIADRPKAVLVRTRFDKDIWLPKALINIKRTTETERGAMIRFEISESLAAAKGLW